MSGDWGYEMEKFDNARRALLPPHPRGEAVSYALAFQQCDLALTNPGCQLGDDDSVGDDIATIKRIMDTSGVERGHKDGAFAARAEQLSLEDKAAFSKAVDRLASYYSMEFWSRSRPG